MTNVLRSGPLSGTNLILLLFYIFPRGFFFDFNLRATSAHFWHLKFFIPRRVDLTQWSPYGVPFESLSLVYPPRWTFLAFNLLNVSAHFWPAKFFIPQRVDLTQWSPYVDPFESLSLLYWRVKTYPKWRFLTLNLHTVSAHFWPPRFFFPRRWELL